MMDLPTPSGYRQSVPVFPDTELSAEARRATRKRYIAWFGVAVALHLALFLGWWLTPPLRLKAGYAPDRWVPVVSIPKVVPKPPAVAPADKAKPATVHPPMKPHPLHTSRPVTAPNSAAGPATETAPSR